MAGRWHRKPNNQAATVIYVHGILSSGEICWRHQNGAYWPELLKNEPDFESLGIYVYTYQTGFGTGSYSLSNVVDDLKEHLINLDEVLSSNTIIFVCHSMGGIIVRKFLVERVQDLLDRNIEVGLYLVASPSLGSDYANWLEPIAKVAGHAQAKALRFSDDNQWLNDLDKTFQNLKESKRLKLRGKELVEDKFVILKNFWRKQIVPSFSGARYFGESFKVAGSDHSSIAKPKDKDEIQHRLLLKFLKDFPSVGLRENHCSEKNNAISKTSHQNVKAEESQDQINVSPDVMEKTVAPLPEIDPQVMELAMQQGSMACDSQFYISRQSDDDMEHLLTQKCFTVIVKGARQSGKSSLLVRVEAKAKSQGCLVCYIDFQSLDESQLTGLDGLLLYLIHRLARDLKTAIKPKDSWDENLGAKENASNFIEDAILSGSQQKLVLLLDEADRVFKYHYRNDFFGLLRFWTNRRANSEIWQRFSLVIAHSTDPVLWIDDINQSPFNVGFPIPLHNFDLHQFTQLADRYRVSYPTGDELTKIHKLIDGHPFLAQQSLYLLGSNKITPLELQDHATRQDGPFGDHLRRLSGILSKREPLRKALFQVLKDNTCQDEHSFQRLCAAGLLVGESRQNARLACSLYEKYFRNNL